jgi:hypothetical protein
MSHIVLAITKEAKQNRVSITPEQAPQLVSLLQPKSFVACEVNDDSSTSFAFLQDKDFWRNLHATLKDDSIVSVTTQQPLEQLLKMSGFANVKSSESQVVAIKPIFKTGGTSIRDRKAQPKEEVNPWGNLDAKPSMIDEDALMADETVKQATD